MFNFSLRRPGWSKAAAQAGLDLAILLPQSGLGAYFLLTKTKMKVKKNKKRSKCKVFVDTQSLLLPLAPHS